VKLSDYAAAQGVSYRTAWRWFHSGIIKGRQLPTGTILVDVDDANTAPAKEALVKDQCAAVYARVSSAENKANLEGQAARVASYCAAKGWTVRSVVKEVGSGLNDQRPKLLKLLADDDLDFIVVEHKDRLTRFGFHYIETLLGAKGRRVVVINEADGAREDLVQDFVGVITSFCARIYGQRRAKRKTEKLLEELRSDVESGREMPVP
jgi:predicted site-specific integrase-resolvase